MASTKGNILMAAVAVLPPALVVAAYLLDLAPAHPTSSLWAKVVPVFVHGIITYLLPYKYFTNPLHRFPSAPDDHWLLGHVISELRDKPQGKRFIGWMKQVANDGIFRIHGVLHAGNYLVVTKPETAMEILNTHNYDWEKPGPPKHFLRRTLGDGLVVVEGNEHKVQRRHVAPAFTGKQICDLIPLFWRKSFAFTDAIQRESDANGGWLAFGKVVSRVTLDIIGLAGIGRDFATTENAEDELAEQYEHIMSPDRGNLVRYALVELLVPQSIIRRFDFGPNTRAARAGVELRRICSKLLDEKAATMAEKPEAQKDIIATLMRGGKFTNEGLTNQLLTFLAAGHETTANALTWGVFILARRPEIQARLRKDCQSALGSLGPDESPTAEQLDSLAYLDAVCSETLRYYPTVPTTGRVSVRETHIGDEVIPKGCFVFISPWALNRSGSVWGADAHEFNPDRWLGAEGSKYGGASSPYAFLTFLYGPRSCIGQSFARYEFKCLLAVLLLKYEFKLRNPAYEPIPAVAITLKPMKDMDLLVTPVQ